VIAPPPSAPLRLMLVDDDPIFCMGLKIWLEQTGQCQVVAEAKAGPAALDSLINSAETPWNEDDTNRPDGETPPLPDLVLIDVGLGQGDPAQLPGLLLCREIKTRFPVLPVLVLSATHTAALATAARGFGANGFGLRSLPVADLVQLIQQTQQDPSARPAPVPPPLARPWGSRAPTPPGPLLGLRRRLQRSALTQIDGALADLEARRQAGSGELWLGAVQAGRYRELRAARWLMERLLVPPADGGSGARLNVPTAALATAVAPNLATLPSAPEAIREQVFEQVFAQLQADLTNRSGVPLELDILREDKKRELLFLCLRQWEVTLDGLRQAQVPLADLPQRGPGVLRDLWRAVVTEFFRPYTSQALAFAITPDQPGPPLADALLPDVDAVYREVLAPVPQVPALLGHLLYLQPITVDGVAYAAATPQALARSQALLGHLLLTVACGVMQPLLNRFADVEPLKTTLYHRRLITSRDIERFRNDLSWRYRWDRLVHEPKAIFESQYRLFQPTPQGIQLVYIYAPRRAELDQLSGTQRALTLAIETRDALAPRLRSAVSWVGSGVVYVLTEIVGRGLGLVGRGILKGVGGGWNDPRLRTPSDQRSNQDS